MLSQYFNKLLRKEGNMDQQIEQYLNNLVQSTLQAPVFQSLNEDQKKETSEKIADYFNQVILDALIDNLTDSQLDQIQGVDPNSPEFASKLEAFAGEVPGFAYTMQDQLSQEAEKIKQTGQIPQ